MRDRRKIGELTTTADTDVDELVGIIARGSTDAIVAEESMKEHAA